MSELKVCRICLSTDVKMFKYDRYQLKYYYEQVMALKANEHDGLPQCFCYECAAMLHKFHKFKEKCYSGQKALKEILWRGPITLKAVSMVDRYNKNLQSILEIVKVNRRTRTIMVRNDVTIKSKLNSTVTKNIPKPEPENVNIQLDSDIESMKNDDDFVNFEIDGEKEFIDEAKIRIDDEKIDTEKLIADDLRIIDFENIINEKIDEPIVEEKTIDDDQKEVVGEKIIKSNKKKEANFNPKAERMKNRRTTQTEGKKIKIRQKKDVLNPNNWQKFHLSEEEAVSEFQAKAQDQKYIKAIYKCTSCIKGFSQEDMLKRHIKLRHSESNGSMECRFCRIRFKWKSLLSIHAREHYNKYKCLRCDLTFCRESSASHHDEYHNGVIRTCEYCNEKFKHMSTYYTHLRTHRSKHICTLCGESFLSEFGLYMHRKVKHILDMENQDSNAEETIYCEQCDIKLETRKAYEEHLIRSAMHSATEETTALMNLKSGTIIRRTPRKQTLCTICNITFSTLVSYTKHHQSEHPDVPLPVTRKPKPNHSNHSAAQNQERHICEICGALVAPKTIYSHMNSHTREKQYTCKTCGMQFNAKFTLQRHYLTHTDEKPVKCSLCDKRFKLVASMRVHYNTIHLKQPYPKRNRKKKTQDPEETALIAGYYQNKEGTDDMALEKWRTLRL